MIEESYPEKCVLEPSERRPHGPFALLTLGYFFSQLGAQIAGAALVYWLKDTVGSASVMGLAAVVLSLSIAIASPWGGIFADKYSRRRVAVTTDILAMLVCLAAGIVIQPLTRASGSDLPTVITFIVLLNALLGILLGLYEPAFTTWLADIVRQHRHLSLSSAAKNISLQLAGFCGQGAAFFVYMHIGMAGILFANGLSFGVSACCQWCIAEPVTDSETTETTRKHALTNRPIFFEAAHYCRQHTHIRFALVLNMFINLLAGPFIVLLPFFVETQLHAPAYWYGYLAAIFGLGGIVGFLAVPIIKTRYANSPSVMAGSGVLFGVVLLGLSYTHAPWLAASAFCGAGFFYGVITVMSETSLLEHTQRLLRGRVISLFKIVTRLALPAGMFIAGLGYDVLSTAPVNSSTSLLPLNALEACMVLPALGLIVFSACLYPPKTHA